jgi:hypothetical protein
MVPFSAKLNTPIVLFAVEGNSSREVEVLVLILLTEAVDASYIQNQNFSPPLSELLRRNQKNQTDK